MSKTDTVRTILNSLNTKGIDGAYELIRQHYIQCLRKNISPAPEVVAAHLTLLSFEHKTEAGVDEGLEAEN